MSILSGLPDRAAVAVVRLRSLGDCVLTTPALYILRSARPDLRVGVVVDERFAPVFARNPDIDEILPPSLKALRSFRPELCVNFHGGTRSLTLTVASGARLRVGFAHFRGAGTYNCRIPTAQEILATARTVHTAEHLASAVFWLGAPHMPVPRARLFASPPEPSAPYAVIHPLASTPQKTWPAAGFVQVAEELKNEHEIEPVFVAGPGDDLSAFSRFRTVLSSSLESTKSLISGACLFIGNDSGPAHIAAGFGVPVVALFGPSDPRIWAPWQVDSEVLQADPISAISADRVRAAAARLLAHYPTVSG